MLHPLKEKNTSKTSYPVAMEYLDNTLEILDLNNEVTLVADIEFVNCLGIFVSTSRWIKFTILEYIPKRIKGKW